MRRTKPGRSLTLAIHPSSRGFGWVVFEGPFAPYDWGLVEAKRDRNIVCLRRAEQMFERYQPQTLVMETFEAGLAVRARRVSNFCRALVALASDRGIDVAIHSLADVRSCFANVGARTRHEIAEATIRHVDAFRHRLPKRRRAWDSEDPRMAMFSAIAVALCHYAIRSDTLLNEMNGI